MLIKEKSKEIDSTDEFWDAVKTLDWMGAAKLASNNIQTIQEYAVLLLKVVFYNLTLFLSTLSGRFWKDCFSFGKFYNSKFPFGKNLDFDNSTLLFENF